MEPYLNISGCIITNQIVKILRTWAPQSCWHVNVTVWFNVPLIGWSVQKCTILVTDNQVLTQDWFNRLFFFRLFKSVNAFQTDQQRLNLIVSVFLGKFLWLDFFLSGGNVPWCIWVILRQPSTLVDLTFTVFNRIWRELLLSKWTVSTHSPSRKRNTF